jgi:hypothetical protein
MQVVDRVPHALDHTLLEHPLSTIDGFESQASIRARMSRRSDGLCGGKEAESC